MWVFMSLRTRLLRSTGDQRPKKRSCNLSNLSEPLAKPLATSQKPPDFNHVVVLMLILAGTCTGACRTVEVTIFGRLLF